MGAPKNFITNRKKAAEIANDTLEIIQKGYYIVNNQKIDIAQMVEKSIQETCSYPPEYKLPKITSTKQKTVTAVENDTTLKVAQKLISSGYKTMALNFASAKNPGGGFRRGALAQEESLARASALYPCIVNNQMYNFHKAHNNPMYTNYAIYSPQVPVFKDDQGNLLQTPYLCSFITSPAVNAGAVSKKKQRSEEIKNAMRERIIKVLTIAAMHQNQACVLGAWGCGVFRNSTSEIAQLFHEALRENFQGVFQKVVFAVMDWSEDKHFIGPFYKYFN